MDYVDIIYTKQAHVAKITLNRPDKMNAFGPEMHDGIYRAFIDANEDKDVRIIVLTATVAPFLRDST